MTKLSTFKGHSFFVFVFLTINFSLAFFVFVFVILTINFLFQGFVFSLALGSRQMIGLSAAFRCRVGSRGYQYPNTKYMTLAPKFFLCSKMAVTRRRSNLFPKFWKIPAALDEYFAMAVSNRDLKPSGTFFWKNCMRPRIRRLLFLDFCPPPEGD